MGENGSKIAYFSHNARKAHGAPPKPTALWLGALSAYSVASFKGARVSMGKSLFAKIVDGKYYATIKNAQGKCTAWFCGAQTTPSRPSFPARVEMLWCQILNGQSRDGSLHQSTCIQSCNIVEVAQLDCAFRILTSPFLDVAATTIGPNIDRSVQGALFAVVRGNGRGAGYVMLLG